MTQAEPIDSDGSDTAAVRLAQQIRQRRHAQGLSQSDLATMIGYTPQYVSLAERPRKGLPSASLVEAIDNALRAGGLLIELHRLLARAAGATLRDTLAQTVQTRANVLAVTMV